MAEDEASTRSEDDADECLHCAIVDMVEERIASGGADGANLAALIAESLVDASSGYRRRSRRSLWRTRWRLWATSFFRRAAPDRHPIDLMSSFCSHARTSSSFFRRGPGGNNSYHPPCGPRRLLCIGRAIARSLVARQADRRGGRSRARRLVRGQGLWNQRRHVRTAGARALSAPDLCWRTF